MFEEQKKQAEENLEGEKLSHITGQIKNRLRRKEILINELKQIDQEVTDFVDKGELKNLNDYIEIDDAI